MPKFIPLDEIEEMSEEERYWLKKSCFVFEGYYDSEEDKFVVKKTKGTKRKRGVYCGRGTNFHNWKKMVSY